MKSSDGVLLTELQERESSLLKGIAELDGWEVETMLLRAKSGEMEYQLRSPTRYPGREKNYCLVRGTATLLTDQVLELFLMEQLRKLQRIA